MSICPPRRRRVIFIARLYIHIRGAARRIRARVTHTPKDFTPPPPPRADDARYRLRAFLRDEDTRAIFHATAKAPRCAFKRTARARTGRYAIGARCRHYHAQRKDLPHHATLRALRARQSMPLFHRSRFSERWI